MPQPLEYTAEPFCLTESHAQHLADVAKRVGELWDSHPSVPYYTTHGPIHNRTIVGLLARLIPESMKSPDHELERYLLLSSAWLHDVGMLNLKEFEEAYRPDDVRKSHHERSARYLMQCAAELRYSSAEAHILAWLVKMHRKKENLEGCPECMQVGSETLRVRLLAALLRLADALHIDESRAPYQEYSLYKMTGMPPEAKFHWVKARAVQGIHLDLKQGLVEVQIGVPMGSTDGKFRPLADFVQQEIESELETVRRTLAKEGCPFFVEAHVKPIQVPGMTEGSAPAKEIVELNNLISIDVSPNARRLEEEILQSIEQISPKDRESYQPRAVEETLRNLKDYARDLVPKVVGRRCHVATVRAFVALVLLLRGEEPRPDWLYDLSLLKLLDDKVLPKAPATQDALRKRLLDRIDGVNFPKRDADCLELLKRVRRYFEWELRQLTETVQNLKNQAKAHVGTLLQKGDRILLYGLSDSVLDLLDAGATELGENVEVLVAECRVKSNYSTTNTPIYNDGLEYARKVVDKKYKHVAIVPDAAIAHLLLPESYYADALEQTSDKAPDAPKKDSDAADAWLANPTPITKILFGFNGLDLENKFAVHSCGHLALTLLAKYFKEKNESRYPQVYLVGTSSKCGRLHYKHVEPRSTKTWLTGRVETLSDLKVWDYNPVDDIIKLELVDVILSDLGAHTRDEFIDAYKAHCQALLEDPQCPMVKTADAEGREAAGAPAAEQAKGNGHAAARGKRQG